MAILDQLKFNLGLSGTTDQDTDLNTKILNGKATINDLIGSTTIDYETAGPAQTLLLNYCRYDYNNALEYFEENFSKEILRLQLQTAAAEAAEAAADA